MRRGTALFALLAGCLALLVACGRPSTSGGVVLPPGGDFVLATANGVLDSKALRGKVLVMFFGYTHCPDVCPANMAAATQMLATMSASERARVRMIFVSVDPGRDTPDRLKEYAAYFHPDVIGATGTRDEISAVARNYGVGYVLHPPGADGSYTVDHSVSTYIVGPDGKLSAVVGMGQPVGDVVAAIRALL